MKISDYSLADASAAQELTSNSDFIAAFCGSLDILGALMLFHPVKDPEGASALAALRSIDVAQDWPFGSEDALVKAATLLKAGMSESETDFRHHFMRLFRGPGKLPAAIWGSVYLDNENVVYGDSWMELRAWMKANGVRRVYEENEPEDQIGRLMLLCSEVARNKPELLCELLGSHVLTWTGRFFQYFTPAAFGSSEGFDDASLTHIQPSDSCSPTYTAVALLLQATLDEAASLLGITPARMKLYR